MRPEQLRARRLGLGPPQTQLAERLGVRSNTVARWERGELPPAHPRLVALAFVALERSAPGAALPGGDP